MTVNERSRHELHLRLESVLGPEAANTMMEMLPPVGWADVATKRDLDQLAEATRRQHDQLTDAAKRDLDQLAAANQREHELLAKALTEGLGSLRGDLAQLRGEIAFQARTFTLSMIGSIVTVAGLAFAAARLA